MGNCTCSGDGGQQSEMVVSSKNRMHMRKVQTPRVSTGALPQLPDLKGTAKANAAEGGLYEDPEFPPTDASLGGITGDQANPQVSEYLAARKALDIPLLRRFCVGRRAVRGGLWGFCPRWR